MKDATTIQIELDNFLKRNGYTLQYFSEQSGINVGTLSRIVNGNRPISMEQLDRLTSGMGLEEGTLYDLFVDEFFVHHSLNWRRLRPFLLRCAELKKHGCIQKILSHLLEDLKQIPNIFITAEIMYENGWKEAAAILYSCVVETEKYQHAERLAISQYRLFQLSLGSDTTINLRAAIQFEPYKNRLPENFKLDAILQLANIYYTVQDWRKMEDLGDELRLLAYSVYSRRQFKEEESSFKSERHLVVYYGQGYLIKSAALEHQGRYEEAKEFIDGYADLSWFEGLDDEGLYEVEKFKLFAEANLHNINLLMGNFEGLPAYVTFLMRYPNEALPSSVIVLMAANKHGVRIDDILVQLIGLIDGCKNSYYHEANYTNRYINFYFQLALYQLNSGKSEGLDNILRSLEMSLNINNRGHTLACITELLKEWLLQKNDEKLSSLEGNS
ncbi:helix-turn-helix transcriptional regulator [Paenibacillus woosongensis]|uniref:Helix-turn-helix transcriptional regulator n=1 Tax=Paenibacillus woosongensis TaxID=307580 RepID=A0AA95IBD8_9BACL|nr:helix-turn-helix transcriptional regulator [Paenibacillus woosongensis]WHX49505.1 helix-turn-helix transcriptional regulator [Paenibacillus woosongensis]